MTAHQDVAIVVGEQTPAMSISYERGSYVVFFAEFDPESPDDGPPSMPVCLGCLVEDGDEQVGRGLDLARKYGQVDFDVEDQEWFVAATGELVTS